MRMHDVRDMGHPHGGAEVALHDEQLGPCHQVAEFQPGFRDENEIYGASTLLSIVLPCLLL